MRKVKRIVRPIDGKFDVAEMDDGSIEIVKKNGAVVPRDEPLFLTRARDENAIGGLEDYYARCLKNGCNEWQLEGILASKGLFEIFKAQHPERMKQPGITMGGGE